MAVIGYQFDRAKVAAINDANVYDFLNRGESTVIPGRGKELLVSLIDGQVTIASGCALIQGRLVEITEALTVPVPDGTDGFVVMTLDLSAQNVSTGTPEQSDYAVINNQLRVEFVETLIPGDTLNGDLLFTFPLAIVKWTDTGMMLMKQAQSYAEVDGNPWIAPNLNAGFTILNPNYPPGFRKKRGVLQFSGAIDRRKKGMMFTLPEGYRPRKVRGRSVALVSGSPGAVASIYVHPNGQVELAAASSDTVGVWLDFEVDLD